MGLDPILSVREARPEDDAAIGEVLVTGFREAYALKMPDVVVNEARIADLRDVTHKRERGCVLVAEWQGQVVGSVTIYPPGAPDSRAWLPGTADLRYLAIAPAHHGKGWARALLDAAEAKAIEWGAAAVSLHVRRGATGVARLYESRGYKRAPEGDRDFPAVSVDGFFLPFQDGVRPNQK